MINKYIKTISVSLIITITILMFSNISYAEENTKWIAPEKTQRFKNWEKLPEEKRENTIMPVAVGNTFKNTIKRSKYNSILNQNKANLEARYQRPAITIKDQEETGTCWAFAFSSVLEGSGKGKEYSPFYLNYLASTIYNRKIIDGGNFRMAMGASSIGKYPVVESKMPTNSVYNKETNPASSEYMIPLNELPEEALEQTIDARITDAIYFPSIYKQFDSSGNVKYLDIEQKEYTTNQVQAMRTLIKEHVKNEGPICTSIYAEHESHNANTGAYFYKSNEEFSNHEVVIVGWDDNYEVSNFSTTNRPKNPGAYICLNSQGATNKAGSIGKDGYVYVSYEDKLIESSMYGITNIEEYDNKDQIPYDKIYQYDEQGFTYEIGAEKTKLMAANVFSRDNSKSEYINEVGLFIPSAMGIQIYVNGASGDKTQLKEVAVEVENIETGYHVIKLANPIKLTGSQFVVAVKYINKEEIGRIPLEANFKDSGISEEIDQNITSNAKANPGESFVSLDEGQNWKDVNGLNIGNNIVLKNTNTCIKAYTTISNEQETKPVTGVTLNKTTTKIKVDETETLVATVSPSDATNKNVTWKSSDETIATVANGVVTGKKEGNATITVTTQEGSKVATCNVTVEENEEEPTVVEVTGVELDKTEDEIKVGETVTLKANILPENATNKNITWKSSDETIATVENGVVTGKKAGKATITVTTRDGNHTANCDIEVTRVEVTGVTLNKNTLNLEVGDKGNLVATIEPKEATQKQVKWESLNEKVATISETGIIKAISEGKTTIRVITIDGNFIATCELTVSKKKNTEDDIYKDDDNKTDNENTSNNTNTNTNTNKNTINKDNTLAQNKIPYAGNDTILIVGIIIGIIAMAIIFIKVRTLRDVK